MIDKALEESTDTHYKMLAAIHKLLDEEFTQTVWPEVVRLILLFKLNKDGLE